MALARIQRQKVEPLSPRSANIQFKAKNSMAKDRKAMEEEEAKKAEAARKAAKEKEYAPEPPEWVIQPPLHHGDLAEKYRIGYLLGKGGFAVAYEGEFRSKKSAANSKVFALKVVRAKMSQKKMEDKFRTELQIHAKMRHPNIVEFHRAFTYKESTYVVLEMCSNGSVMDMVKKRRCLSLPEVRRLMVQLCGAIKYMHARNVIHRDLKMGNLFLDHDMNLKIGDFGLAAVLVSKDEYEGLYAYAKSRRTTLCGTPNYIAPEILEKGKGGHDHKVDLWAIGVILFAMLAGQPPFQSSSQNEIYQRARNVDYSWPQESKNSNDIPQEAKDLVSRLLKVDAEQRPDPDQVVGHSFFSMHGGDAIPAKMEDCFRFEAPHYLDSKSRPRGDVMKKGTERLSLRVLAKDCGVGHLLGDINPQAAVGADMDLSLYKECAAEEAAGIGPIVPLPKDTVYASKHSLKMLSAQPSHQSTKDNTEDRDPGFQEVEPARTTIKNDFPKPMIERVGRGPIPSHAATLRAAACNAKSAAKKVEQLPLKGDIDPAEPKATTTRSTRGRCGLLTELPVRPATTTGLAGEQVLGMLDRKAKTSRLKKVTAIDDDVPVQAQPTTLKASRPMTTDELIDATSPDPEKKRREISARTRARIASNVQKEMKDKPKRERKVSFQFESIRSSDSSGTSATAHGLIGPDEVIEHLSATKPNDVLSSLQKLHKRLEGSLDDINQQHHLWDETDIKTMKAAFSERPVVTKWVDYTNKFGIGYILANGTVGCVFKEETISPTCLVVPDADVHLRKRKIANYAYKHQIVSPDGPFLEFIESCGDEGLKRVLEPPSKYQVKISSSGIPEKLFSGGDIFDTEKRKKICLWEKFSKYMHGNLSKPEEAESLLPSQVEEPVATRKRSNTIATISKSAAATRPFVRFYQRVGNVGVWGFGDNSLQFNFPDHTKLIISADGTWVDFYHLPIHAALSLHPENAHRNPSQKLHPADLAARNALCYPTHILLKGEHLGANFEDVVSANQLREKVGFARDLVGLWVKEGGLGRMGEGKGRELLWKGIKESGGKCVWASIGAEGGDKRWEAGKIRGKK